MNLAGPRNAHWSTHESWKTLQSTSLPDARYAPHRWRHMSPDENSVTKAFLQEVVIHLIQQYTSPTGWSCDHSSFLKTGSSFYHTCNRLQWRLHIALLCTSTGHALHHPFPIYPKKSKCKLWNHQAFPPFLIWDIQLSLTIPLYASIHTIFRDAFVEFSPFYS